MDIFDGHDVNDLANQLLINENNFNAFGELYDPTTISAEGFQDWQNIVNDAIRQDLVLDSGNALINEAEELNVIVVLNENLKTTIDNDEPNTLVIVHNI